eukprot:c11821_g1_i3.p2 GENE.c11821_g1_i3~~c11821_g1_i3.p2  ORF type:complete len:224 (+),score=44.14 c11821_g1_i3:327-998(+)
MCLYLIVDVYESTTILHRCIIVCSGDMFSVMEEASCFAVQNLLLSCNASHFVSLTIESCISVSYDIVWLVNVLAHLTHLSHLNLRGNCLDAERVKRMCGVMCCLTHITHLNMASNFISTAIQSICDCIHNMPNITYLNLEDNNINSGTGEGSKLLSDVLAHKTKLTELNLSRNSLGSHGVLSLIPAFSNMPNLTRLCVRANGFHESTNRKLSKHLPQVTEFVY